MERFDEVFGRFGFVAAAGTHSNLKLFRWLVYMLDSKKKNIPHLSNKLIYEIFFIYSSWVSKHNIILLKIDIH